MEHWVSIDLTYRYHSHASLWWPAHGEDINVGNLPPTAGKAVQLEMKTTYLNKKGDVHQVKISLKQLDRYLKRPLRQATVLRLPSSALDGRSPQVAAPADCVPATEVGFRRADYAYPSTATWWFAEWLLRLTTDQVEAIVAQISPRPSRDLGGEVRLGRSGDLWPHVRQALYDWAGRCPSPHDSMAELWPRLDECGAAAWHQPRPHAHLCSWPTQDRST